MPKVISSSSAKEAVYCDVCFASIARRADLPRHMKLHDESRGLLMYQCPEEACSYASLQKCNVDTHIRTHTGEKSHHCPSCDFKTSDPGSLTRHRKRNHKYVPKPRRPRLGGSKAAPKKANRHAPYPAPSPSASRNSPAESESSSSWVTTSGSGSGFDSGPPSPSETGSQISDGPAPPPSESDAPTPSATTQVNMVLIDELYPIIQQDLFKPTKCSSPSFCSTSGTLNPLDLINSSYSYPWHKQLSEGAGPSTQVPSDMSNLLSSSLYGVPKELFPASSADFAIHGPEQHLPSDCFLQDNGPAVPALEANVWPTDCYEQMYHLAKVEMGVAELQVDPALQFTASLEDPARWTSDMNEPLTISSLTPDNDGDWISIFSGVNSEASSPSPPTSVSSPSPEVVFDSASACEEVDFESLFSALNNSA